MLELVLIYVFLVLLPRFLRGKPEAQQRAPQRKQARPQPPFDTLGGKPELPEEDLPGNWELGIPFPGPFGWISEGERVETVPETVMTETVVAKGEEPLSSIIVPPSFGPRLKKRPGLPRKNLWAEGIVMAVIISPPRSLRPWHPNHR